MPCAGCVRSRFCVKNFNIKLINVGFIYDRTTLYHLQVGLVAAWYAGNTLYNIYNKKATNMIHAHWFVAAAQLVVGVVWSLTMWGTGLRKTPNLTASDIAACVPIGLFACLAHAGSVLAVSAYDV